MKTWIAATLIALAPSTAFAAGGGGVTLGAAYMPRFGTNASPHRAPGFVGCIGGIGYGVFGKDKTGLRIGGDGAYCRNKAKTVQASYGGAQLGVWRGSEVMFWSAYTGLGGGVLNDASTPNQDAFRSIYLYAKPTLSFGFALGPTAVETGLYAMVPINVVQDVGNGVPRGFVTPNVGLQVSFMFGWFKDKRGREVKSMGVEPPPPITPEPVADPIMVVPQQVAPEAPAPTVCPPCNCEVDVQCGDVIIGGDVNAGDRVVSPGPAAEPAAPQQVVPDTYDPWLQWYDHSDGDHPAEEPPCVHAPYGPDCPQYSGSEGAPRDTGVVIPEAETRPDDARPLALPVPDQPQGQ